MWISRTIEDPKDPSKAFRYALSYAKKSGDKEYQKEVPERWQGMTGRFWGWLNPPEPLSAATAIPLEDADPRLIAWAKMLEIVEENPVNKSHVWPVPEGMFPGAPEEMTFVDVDLSTAVMVQGVLGQFGVPEAPQEAHQKPADGLGALGASFRYPAGSGGR